MNSNESADGTDPSQPSPSWPAGSNNPDALRRSLGSGVLSLDPEDIQGLLPHQSSMIMVDRVLTLVPRRHAVGMKAVSGNEYGLCRRDHGFIFPATLAVESLAQLAALLWLYPIDGQIPKKSAARLREDGNIVGSLGEVQNLTVHNELINPDRISLEVSLVEEREGSADFRGLVGVHGTEMVSAAFSLLL